MSEVAPAREIPNEPQGKAELKIAIGAECGLDLRQRIATTGSAPANVMFRQDTLVRIAVRLPNSRGDARNPRDLTCDELRAYISGAVGEEPPIGQFSWVHLKRIYESLAEREVRCDGGTEQPGTERILDEGERARQVARGDYGDTELDAKIHGPSVTDDEYNESLKLMKVHQGEGSLAGWTKLSLPTDVERVEEFIGVLEDARDELAYLKQAQERPQPGDRDE